MDALDDLLEMNGRSNGERGRRVQVNFEGNVEVAVVCHRAGGQVHVDGHRVHVDGRCCWVRSHQSRSEASIATGPGDNTTSVAVMSRVPTRKRNIFGTRVCVRGCVKRILRVRGIDNEILLRFRHIFNFARLCVFNDGSLTRVETRS